MPHSVVQEELALLERVREALRTGPERGGPSEAALVEELQHIREELVRGGGDELDRSALQSRWTAQKALLDQLRSARSGPEVDPDSPYFAHLRLREGDRVRELCLGKATRLDRGLRIVDWRHAPIAQLFYRYRQGDEYEESIGGRRVEGSVEARRTVAIRGGRLCRVEAPEGTFVADAEAEEGWRRAPVAAPRLRGGEGAALRVHAPGEGSGKRLGAAEDGAHRGADKHLPDVAALLDPEQFALIARQAEGFLAIRGSAGSGKTTVALHRIAWLAYRDPEIDSGRTLFAVFSRALRDYVSHVLPALGVERVQVRTFADWAAEQRRRILPQLPDRHRPDTPALVQRLKLHPAILTALERQVARADGPPTRHQVFDDWVSVLTQPLLLARVFAEHAPGSLSPRQIEEVCDWCRRRHEELLSWMDGDKSAPGELDPADDALLLRAWQLRVGPLPGRREGQELRLRHAAIDEVQDFSPLEVRVLLDCLDERRSLTLAGDAQQHVAAESGFASWPRFLEELGVSGTELSTLQVSYRSTREIATFAETLLGGLRDEEEAPALPTRSGPAVELFTHADHGAAIASLADALADLASREPLASAALLAPTAELADLYFEGLERSEVPRAHRVRHQDFRFAPGVEVTEIAQVKGLEFDYVILVEVSEAHFPDEPRARRLLHVGATRAVHQLWLTSVEPPSKVVTEAVRAAGSG